MSDANSLRKKHLPYYIAIAASGACIIFIALASKGSVEDIWLELLKHIGMAFIIGPTISLILDLPSMINYFKKITIKSLVSDDYLNALSSNKLLDLRKKCTAKIHLKGSTVVEQGLIDLDESVCELLTQYYHERYRQNVSCRIDGEFVFKKHHIEEVIINPLVANGGIIKIPENMNNFLFRKPDENPNDIFKLLKYTVAADDEKEIDYIKEGIKLKEVPSDTTDMTYNSLINIVDKDNNSLEFEFHKCLKIEKVYEVRVPKSDIAFLKRVKIPVKSFRLDYHFPDSGVKLAAACFGTLAFSSDGDIKIIHEDDHVSIEAYSWLLPGNGVFVVAV